MLDNKKLVQVVVSGAMALLFVNFYLKQKEENIEVGYGMVKVLAASRDIPPHTALNAEFLTTKEVPSKYVEPGAIQVKYPGQETDRIRGKVTVSAIAAGSTITQSNLNYPDVKESGVAPLLPPGKRGFTLRLGNMDVADLILPGDHVDILATLTVRVKDGESKATYTILQNILVVGVGKDLKPRNLDVASKKEVIEGLVLTVAVEPAEAERLALAVAQAQGEISVVIRPHGDNSVKAVPGATPSNLVR
jgi:pilus assembly protein CpaB